MKRFFQKTGVCPHPGVSTTYLIKAPCNYKALSLPSLT